MKRIKYILCWDDGRQGAPKTVDCADNVLDAVLSIARAEAYNGEVTVEDVPLIAEEARAERNKLLEESDWTQVLDAPIDSATREAYRTYRQAL